MKKKLIVLTILFASVFQVTRADEGMWLFYLAFDGKTNWAGQQT